MKYILVAICLSLFSTLTFSSPNYIGLNFGNHDIEGTYSLGNIGITYGRELFKKNSYQIQVEGQYATTVAEESRYVFGYPGPVLDINSDIFSVHGVFKLGEPGFIKARLGYSKVKHSASNGTLSFESTASGLSYSLGLGYSFSNTFLLEYQFQILPDLDFEPIDGIEGRYMNVIISYGY